MCFPSLNTTWVALSLAKHTIDTGDARPIKQTLRRQPFAHLETIDKQVQDMLKTGIIEPSQSPWVSNVVIVTKKDGSARFCVDYRRVNEVTRKDAYPLPRIETCLDALGGARYFSTFDLRSGYHQVKMDEADADKTSFVTRRGTFKFNVLPFGLTNAGATFQRVMDVAMSGSKSVHLLDLPGRYNPIFVHSDRAFGKVAMPVCGTATREPQAQSQANANCCVPRCPSSVTSFPTKGSRRIPTRYALSSNGRSHGP